MSRSKTLYGGLARRHLVALAAYAAIASMSYVAAFLVRFDFSITEEYFRTFALSLPLLLVIRIASDAVFRLSTGRWRFVGPRDVVRLVGATTAGTVLFFTAVRILPLEPGIPRSVLLIEWLLTAYLTAGLWIVYRTGFEQLRHIRSGINGSARRVLIVGAGEAGNILAREMLRVPTGYRAIGFVDDDRSKWGTRLHGVEVFGSTADLPEISAAYNAQEIVIAIPSASPAELRRLVARCEAADLPFKVLPGIASVLAGDVRLNQIREVRIEDLLGREPIRLELPELSAALRGRSVLITGAAGSIGRELARQIALHEPGALILLDQAETALYYLELELRERHPDLCMVPVVADVVDAAAVDLVFAEYRPDSVFHAAAYKHVPMMEANAREAVRNNVIGTWRVALAAGKYGAGKFVLVSTDKAVRPVSAMGATKRMAELVVLELQDRYPETVYAAVRFGNVLGSNGSVIPIFRRQIEEGRPLTVTHPEATRYFMTIPEAVQLILQASLLPDLRGRVAMLEMGEPVRILDLAENLLRLSGVAHEPGPQIIFTGLRPGERLHEELVAPDEETVATSVPKVRLVIPGRNMSTTVASQLPGWVAALDEGRGSDVVTQIWTHIAEASTGCEEPLAVTAGCPGGLGFGAESPEIAPTERRERAAS